MAKAQLINPELFNEEKYNENLVKEKADILMEAEEIKKDPVLMKKIKEHLDKSSKKIDSLKKLKDIANNYVQNHTDDEK